MFRPVSLRLTGQGSQRPPVGLPRVLARSIAAMPQSRKNLPKLVILGTGWGSFRVLNDIDPSKYCVSVISPRNHLLFTPMLASSALGTVNQRSICQPVRPLVAKKEANYYESFAKSIDKKNKTVSCETLSGHEYVLPYDILVIGVGFQPNDFNTPGVKEHALFMKETADATRFKDHVLAKLEEASYIHALDSNLGMSAEEEARIQECLTFVVVGGGPTGVELAAELTDFLQAEGAKMYPELRKFIKVHMFTFDVLSTFDRELQEHAIRHLRRKQQVDLHLESFVTKVTENELFAKEADVTYQVKYGTLVWCAGVKPHDFVKDFGFAMNERGTQILTDTNLAVKDEKDIYAIGDCCTIEDYWLPQTAQVANQQGQYLAKVISKGTAGTGKPFVFHSKGMMAYLGGASAIMSKLPGLNSLTGFVAFLGWRFTYWFLQLSVRNRFMIATDWLRTLVFGRDLTRFGRRSRPT
jgi:NADH:ubiquinone reductase (non-electrogenic)